MTLIELLKQRRIDFPEKEFLHIWNRANQKYTYSYQNIYENSLKYAKYLKGKGIKKGDTVFIMLLTRVEFFYLFFGTIMAGGNPIPVHPPIFIVEWDDYKEKILHMFHTSKPKYIFCYDQVFRSIKEKILKDQFDENNIIMIESIQIEESVEDFEPYMPQEEECAYIQYTSGTTHLPRGAMLSHRALMNNIKAIGKAIQLSDQDIAVSWLPLYHDMGMIGNFLTSFYYGCTICLIPTDYFIMGPYVFFDIISNYKGTIINAPNFGYVICNKYVTESKLKNTRIDSLKYALIGSDHIEFNDMEEFVDKYTPYGLNENTFLPVYGFAESCLAVTFSELGQPMLWDYIDWEILNNEKRIVSRDRDTKHSLKVFSVGIPIEGQQVKICDDQNNQMKECYLGQIFVKGTMLMNGYHNLPAETNQVFCDGWFKTNDLGYIKNGLLYYFDRISDVVLQNGKIYRPKDFEHYCWNIKDIKRGRSALIGIDKEEDSETQLYLLIETGTLYKERYIAIVEELNEIYLIELGKIPDIVHVVARGSIPQTSSSKTQRYKCKTKVLDQTFDTNFIYDNINKKVLFCKI